MPDKRHQITVNVDLDIEANFFAITPVMALEVALVLALADEGDWIAKDKGGAWYSFECEPQLSSAGVWANGGESFEIVYVHDNLGHVVHHTESLIRIPPTNVKQMNEDLKETSND